MTAGERSVTRAMLQMLGKTRRSVNSLAAEVQAAKGDLEERIGARWHDGTTIRRLAGWP
jgi:hypothetical protein